MTQTLTLTQKKVYPMTVVRCLLTVVFNKQR